MVFTDSPSLYTRGIPLKCRFPFILHSLVILKCFLILKKWVKMSWQSIYAHSLGFFSSSMFWSFYSWVIVITWPRHVSQVRKRKSHTLLLFWSFMKGFIYKLEVFDHWLYAVTWGSGPPSLWWRGLSHMTFALITAPILTL